MASLFKNWRTTTERIDKFLSDKYFTDVNLTKFITSDVRPLTKIEHLTTVTQPKLSTKDSLEISDTSALNISDVLSMDNNLWETVNKETFVFGKTWSIHWFRLEFDVPVEWNKDPKHYKVELHWNSECEVLLVDFNGNIIQGLNATHSRTAVAISTIAKPAELAHYVLYVQASCSDLFGAGNNGLINAPDMGKTFRLVTAQLQLTSVAASTIQMDLKLLLGITEALPNTDIAYQALHVANQIVNTLVDMTTDSMDNKMNKAREILDGFFSCNPANERLRLRLHAIGHCHIDTGWLWRYGETRRKLARSWATAVGLLERHSQMTFVCSQAQQMDWLRQDYPELFVRIKALVRRKQFIPVGGTWVEMDVNLPCCESLCRQFLYGQNFFKEQFGAFCREFWLPDTFGYSPQLPQIMRQAGASRFMTQKLSWSLVNKFPHHSFVWQGLDGSRVVTHFPPGDSYSMSCTVAEILRSATNHADKGRAPCVMYLYGYGDGGQGPTEEMLYALDRVANIDGLPRITHSSPDQFYSDLESGSNEANLCTWSGELFLELHNGTYTTQRQLKLGNFRCEQMMRAVEMLVSMVIQSQCRPDQGDSAIATVMSILEQTEVQWKLILLNQFHDVLPGTSIEQVSDDAYWTHRAVLDWCHRVTHALASILNMAPPFLINPTSWPLVVHNPSAAPLVVPAHSIATIATQVPERDNSVSVDYQFDSVALLHLISNRYFTISVDSQCRIRRMRLQSQPDFMNIISDGSYGNQLVMYDDVPLFWDAWDVMDYHLETGIDIDRMASFRVLQEATVTRANHEVTLASKFTLESTGTVVEQSVTVSGQLEYCQMSTRVIKWCDSHRLIKVKFPTIINAPDAQYRTQAGFHSRPTHRNTSWDAAKYEVCGHDWIHLGETNWGVAVFKEAIFGCSVFGGSVYLSLLRAPTSPDATADRKYLPHVFNYALFPFDSSGSVANVGGINMNRFAIISRLAAHFTWMCTWNGNLFADFVHGSLDLVRSFPLVIESPSNGEVSIDWIKSAGGGNCQQFVMRLHEQTGGRFLVKLISSVPIRKAALTNILEETIETNDVISYTCDRIELYMCPFVIASIFIELADT